MKENCRARALEEDTVVKAESDILTGPVTGEMVLVVEDDEAVRVLAANMLERLGYRVLMAGDGEEAIEIIEGFTGRIHLILTDINMPRIDGRRLCQEVVQMRDTIKFVLMSGYTNDVCALRGILKGGVHFIQKPFSVNALSQKLREVLDS